MGRLLPEWLNANYHKAYPFDESTAAKDGALPSTFLLDMQLLVGGPVDPKHTYISRVDTDGSSVSLYLSTINEKNDAVELGLLARIPMNTIPSTEIPVELKNAEAGVLLNGYVVVGDANIGNELLAAVTEYTEDNAKLYEGVVIPVTNWTAGIVIDGVLYAGNVNFVAGNSVKFRAETITKENGETVPVIYVDCTDTGKYEGEITDDATLLQQVKEMYGEPIYTINGQHPDAKGNIQLNVVELNTEDSDTEDGDLPAPAISIMSEGGVGVITISDARTRPCCTLDDQQIVIDNIAAINERAARIEGLITELETNLNSVSAQLAMIGNQS